MAEAVGDMGLPGMSYGFTGGVYPRSTDSRTGSLASSAGYYVVV